MDEKYNKKTNKTENKCTTYLIADTQDKIKIK